MNKNEFVEEIAKEIKTTKADAEKALNTVVKIITKALADGKDVRLVGFGTWSVASRKATQGRNPRTGATINIAASKQPKFKAGKGLKEAVNNAKSKKTKK